MAAAAVLAVGAGISAYSSIKKSQEEADALERQSYLKKLQAAETMASAERESELTMQKAKDVQGAQISAFGRSGVDLKGTPLLFAAKTMTSATNEADAIMRAGKYRAFSSEYEAANSRLLAGQTRQAGYLTALGGAVSAAGSYGQAKGSL